LGFKQFSDNGIIPFDVTISKIENGSVRKVGFAGGNSVVKKLGDTFALGATSYDNDGNPVQDAFTYESGDKNVVVVDANGNATVKAIGSTKIVVTSKATGKVGVFTVDVDIDGFTLKEKEIVMYLGQDKQMGLNVKPSVAVPFTFTSSNPRVVAALNSGKLQAVKLGEATVTVSYFGHEEVCTVRVVTKEEYLALGYKITQTEQKTGCNASLTGALGGLTLVGALAFVCLAKRKEW
jgi:uncharacterized protein YjdB